VDIEVVKESGVEEEGQKLKGKGKREERGNVTG